jgi:hypothetical protein
MLSWSPEADLWGFSGGLSLSTEGARAESVGEEKIKPDRSAGEIGGDGSRDGLAARAGVLPLFFCRYSRIPRPNSRFSRVVPLGGADDEKGVFSPQRRLCSVLKSSK